MTVKQLQQHIQEVLKAAYTVQKVFGGDSIKPEKISAYEWIECAVLPYEDDDDRNNEVTFESIAADLAQTVEWLKKNKGSSMEYDRRVAFLMIQWAHHNLRKEYWQNIEQLHYSYSATLK